MIGIDSLFYRPTYGPLISSDSNQFSVKVLFRSTLATFHCSLPNKNDVTWKHLLFSYVLFKYSRSARKIPVFVIRLICQAKIIHLECPIKSLVG